PRHPLAADPPKMGVNPQCIPGRNLMAAATCLHQAEPMHGPVETSRTTERYSTVNLPGSPRTILIGADTYPPAVNGAARFAGSLATGLARRGYEVHVVAPSPDGAPVREVRDGV